LIFKKIFWETDTEINFATVTIKELNACELFHVHFNAQFYSAHHKIFVLVSALQKIQNETYIKMRRVTTYLFTFSMEQSPS